MPDTLRAAPRPSSAARALRRPLRLGLAALAVTVLAGGAALLLAAATGERRVAFQVGLPAVRVAAELAPGAAACRGDIDVPASFAGIRVVAGTFGRPGPPLELRVLGPGGRPLAAGRVAAGYPDNAAAGGRVDVVPAGGRVRVCVRNAGAHRVVLYGSPPDTRPDLLADPARPARPALVFLRDRPRSLLALLPDAIERAARFKAGWVHPWLLWALLVAVSAGVPALLAGAYASVRSSSRSEAKPGDGGTRSTSERSS